MLAKGFTAVSRSRWTVAVVGPGHRLHHHERVELLREVPVVGVERDQIVPAHEPVLAEGAPHDERRAPGSGERGGERVTDLPALLLRRLVEDDDLPVLECQTSPVGELQLRDLFDGRGVDGREERILPAHTESPLAEFADGAHAGHVFRAGGDVGTEGCERRRREDVVGLQGALERVADRGLQRGRQDRDHRDQSQADHQRRRRRRACAEDCASRSRARARPASRGLGRAGRSRPQVDERTAASRSRPR